MLTLDQCIGMTGLTDDEIYFTTRPVAGPTR